MGNLKVNYTDVKGVTKTIDNVEDGVSLMELAKLNGIEGIFGDCGGGCACATCHVYVEGDWFEKVGPPDDIEFEYIRQQVSFIFTLSCNHPFSTSLC